MICNRRTFFAAASAFALGSRLAGAGAREPTIGSASASSAPADAPGPDDPLKRLPGNEMVAVCDVYEPRVLRAAEIAGTAAAKVATIAASSTIVRSTPS